MDYSEKDFGKILKHTAQEQRHTLLPEGTDCMRVYDRNLGRFPVTVDLYGKYARVTDYGEPQLSDVDKAKCLDICSRMLYLEPENIVYTCRSKRKNRSQHEKAPETAPAVCTVVRENGLLFEVNLTTYADTGLFLDQRETRSLIRSLSADRTVLNLFSYTGSFSVYAAAGGAQAVTSVDLSATYTKWALRNLERNGYTGDRYRAVCADALSFVKEEISRKKKYDIIIFDPPAFSNSRKTQQDFNLERDWAYWLNSLSELLGRDGFILFSANLGGFNIDKRHIRKLEAEEITYQTRVYGFAKDRAGSVRSWIMRPKNSSRPYGSGDNRNTQNTRTQNREHRDYRKDSRTNYAKAGTPNERNEKKRSADYGNGKPVNRQYAENRGSGNFRSEDPGQYSKGKNRYRERSFSKDNNYKEDSFRYRERAPKYRQDTVSERQDRYSRKPERRSEYSPTENRKTNNRRYRTEYTEQNSAAPSRFKTQDRDRYSDRSREKQSYRPSGKSFSENPYPKRRRSFDGKEDTRYERPESFRENRMNPDSEYNKTRRPERNKSRKSGTEKPYGYDFRPARKKDSKDNPELFW